MLARKVQQRLGAEFILDGYVTTAIEGTTKEERTEEMKKEMLPNHASPFQLDPRSLAID